MIIMSTFLVFAFVSFIALGALMTVVFVIKDLVTKKAVSGKDYITLWSYSIVGPIFALLVLAAAGAR